MVTNLMVKSQNQFCGNITTSNECDTTFTVKTDPSLPVKRKIRFHDLCLPHEILRAIDDLDFLYCTPIQEAILSQVIDGVDAACQSQTGTGKSAAFLISILTRLCRQDKSVNRQPGSPRALILAPTRELVSQIEQDALDLAKHTSLIIASAFGGIAYQEQRKQFSRNQVDILVATPGRLLDFIKQKVIRLNQVQILVIDEADRMLDMGFIPDIRRIVSSTPPKERRQTLFFSATMTPEVIQLSEQWTKKPVRVDIRSEHITADSLEQIVYMTTIKEKFKLIYNLITQKQFTRGIIFCNRRDETQRLQEKLSQFGLHCAILSGDVPQHKRIRQLEDFRSGKYQILVATDVAGRGIHVDGISHVINYNLPLEPENYVHRIGRTARAGASGISVSFADEREAFYLLDIEEFIGCKLTCVNPPEELLKPLPPTTKPTTPCIKSMEDHHSRHRGRRRNPRPSPNY
ncbi:MAG: DEAD/DEAH box helicase [Desulfobulbaceae bacterium]|nr:DEAD/DEAH box helicase [Desulfobulbaceae bacterium]